MTRDNSLDLDLAAALAELPMSMEPASELWAKIEARIRVQERVDADDANPSDPDADENEPQ